MMKLNDNNELSDAFRASRQAILTESLAITPFDGWSDSVLADAARSVGVSKADYKAAFPRGVADLLRYWSEVLDEEMTAEMTGSAFTELKIREKVAFGIEARLGALTGHKEAARRAAAVLAMPHFAKLAASLSWNTADAIWRAFGDRSTDFNFYSKRAILSGVWTSTLVRWLGDDGAGEVTKQFLDARIDNVMQIEKAKGKIREIGLDPASIINRLARARYP